MCRMCYVPAGVLPGKELNMLLSYLALRQKDGCGLLAWKKRRQTKEYCTIDLSMYSELIDKAVEFSTKGHDLLFHARQASIGTVSTKLCQPFWSKEKQIAVCHNGHDWLFAAIAKYVLLSRRERISDSLAFFRLLCEFGEDRIVKAGLWPKSGVWMIRQNGKMRFLQLGGDLAYDSRGVWSSEFPAKWKGKTHKVGQGDYIEGTIPVEKSEFLFSGVNDIDRFIRF